MIKTDKLSTEEKLRLICGKDFWHTEDFNGKIPQIAVSDGPVGLRTERRTAGDRTETIPAVGYPSVQVLANTWSAECARELGNRLADDCKEREADVLLAPGVNIKRHPLNGRNFEYFSEDPYLAGTLAREYICGVQENGVGACLKHFCCNNLEYDRLHQTSDVDERTLREIYYRPFEIACEAKPVSVMCSYNRINGTYGAEYKKGFDLLRDEFGFDGAIFSDWEAVRDRAASARAGLDLEMPFNRKNYRQLCEDYREGKLSEEQINACAERVLALVDRCKEMARGKTVQSTVAERIRTAKRIEEEGIVLLKNEGVLPLKKGCSAAVFGCYAKPDTLDMLRGGGSSCVRWLDMKFDIPKALADRGFSVRYEGAFRYGGVYSNIQNARTALEYAAMSDVAVICAGTGSPSEYEAGDRATMRLAEAQERAIAEIARRCENTVVVLFAGGAIDVSAWADKVNAIVYAGFPGMGGDEAVADVLSGAVCPSGKLSETFPVRLADVPAANAYRSMGVTRYSEGLDVGYRYFDTYEVPVMFPFGHGLSYAAFEYEGLICEPKDGALEVRYQIRNMSQRTGKEVSQLYVCECAPLVYRPKKELKAYAKTEIAGGECKTIAHRLELRAFAHWSTSRDAWVVTDGIYEIMVGASVGDIRLRGKIFIEEEKIRIVR